MKRELALVMERELLGKPFKIYGTPDEPLFKARDVAEWIGHSQASVMVASVDDCEKRTLQVGTMNNVHSAIFLTEDGLYEVLMQSRKPIAKQFKREIKAILKSIRKHGAYMTPETLEAAILNPDTMIKVCQALKEEQDRNRQLEAVNSALTVDKAIMQPKADYFDELVDRNLLTNFRETAKQLGVKERVFVNWLIDHKYVYRDKKGKLMPYAEKNNGLFEVKECVNEKTQWAGTQTLITPKGRETFRLLVIGI